MAASNCPKDLIDGVIGRQGTVEDVELSLEALGDVITATAGLDHGGHELDVHDVREVTRLIQIVETSGLHQLTDNLVGDLFRMTMKSWHLWSAFSRFVQHR